MSQNLEAGAGTERPQTVSDEEAYAGRAQLLTPSPTSSPSRTWKRARRIQGASRGGGVSERGEIRNEECRAGGPYLCNLPVYSGALNSKSQFYHPLYHEKLAEEAKTILHGFNIQRREIVAVTRACARKTEPPVETILILAERKAPPCKAIRKLGISRGLFQANVELADERRLKPVFNSF